MLRGVDVGLELWVADVATATTATATARKLDPPLVNATFGTGFEWLPDSTGILFRAVPPERGAALSGSQVPAGSIVQENDGRTAPVRTFQILLSNAADEQLFEHYFTNQLTLAPVSGGSARPISEPSLVVS